MIERTLKAVMSETSREKKMLLLSHHIAETESQLTIEISERQYQESLKSQLDHHEKDFENQKAKLFKTSEILNSKIMELKVFQFGKFNLTCCACMYIRYCRRTS